MYALTHMHALVYVSPLPSKHLTLDLMSQSDTEKHNVRFMFKYIECTYKADNGRRLQVLGMALQTTGFHPRSDH